MSKFVMGRPVAKSDSKKIKLPKTHAGWLQYIEKKGLPELGKGAYRTVYALDKNRVIKVDREFGYVNGCDNEFEFWNTQGKPIRNFLATIYQHGPSWLIMERAEETVQEITKRLYDDSHGYEAEKVTSQSTEVCNTVRAQSTVSDLHEKNIARFRDGSFKIIDYGIN